MTLRRALIRALDRPGGRAILAAAVTGLARRAAPGVRVRFHRGMWIHESDGIVFVDSPVLDYGPSVFRGWANERARCLVDAAGHWFHCYCPGPGDVVLDIGAGKGEDALAFSQAVGPAGRVIAVEAHPVTFACLRLFRDWNGLDNVTPLHFAITDRAGPVAIESKEGWQANRVVPVAEGSLEAPGITLDELVEREKLSRIDLLKMNIEGAESYAVRGMEKTLRLTRALCISCHDFLADAAGDESLRTKAAVQEAVCRAGFRFVSRDADPRPYLAAQVNAVRTA